MKIDMNEIKPVRWIVLAVGSDPIFWKQTSLAICSLLARSGGRAKITLYTDKPDRYVWLAKDIEIEHLDETLIDKWLGPERFFFRAKPCLILHHWARCPDDAIFYFDSDTLCTGSPLDLEAKLRSGVFFMHLPECRVCDGRTNERREYRRRLLDRPLKCGLALREESMMWNAGVIGLRSGDRTLVETVLLAVDEMTALGLSPRTRLKEQLAFSLAAQDTGNLEAADSHFIHYWGNKIGWARWTDDWLIAVVNLGMTPIMAGQFISQMTPTPGIDAPRATKAQRRKAKLRRWLRLN